MDFIERVFGISPDGGGGGFEAILFLIPLLSASLHCKFKPRPRPG